MFHNKYPYTDFHELNADFLLQAVSNFQTQLDEVDARVTVLESDMDGVKDRLDTAENDIDALEGRMDTAEGDIDDLQAADIALDGRLDALEGANIQDAIMLRNVSSVTAGSSDVVIGFNKDTYTNGVKSAGTDSATIQAATTDAAGVMIPGDKEKLAPMSVDSSGNVTFSGTVAADDPVLNTDLATKNYVDSVGISGVTGTRVKDASLCGNFTSTYGTVTIYERDGFKYGSTRYVHISLLVAVSTAIPGLEGNYNKQIATADAVDSDFNSYFTNTVYGFAAWKENNSTQHTYPIYAYWNYNGKVNIYNMGTPIPSGANISIEFTLAYPYRPAS